MKIKNSGAGIHDSINEYGTDDGYYTQIDLGSWTGNRHVIADIAGSITHPMSS